MVIQGFLERHTRKLSSIPHAGAIKFGTLSGKTCIHPCTDYCSSTYISLQGLFHHNRVAFPTFNGASPALLFLLCVRVKESIWNGNGASIFLHSFLRSCTLSEILSCRTKHFPFLVVHYMQSMWKIGLNMH